MIDFINLGIAHYLCKPIKPQDLLSTIDHITRNSTDSSSRQKSTRESSRIVLTKEFVWDKKMNILFKNGEEFKLTYYDLIVMELMASKINHICTIEEFIAYFYTKGHNLDAGNVRSTIFRLCQKIPKESITSLYGVGYKLLEEN